MLTARLRDALADDRALLVFDFRPEVRRGRVVLYGTVQTPEQRDRALRLCRLTGGVVDVEDRLEVVDGDEAGASEQTEDSAQVYHVVRNGESLWLIARRYGTTTRRLRQLNDLSSSRIYPGRRLRVR